jgi:hypothetical protein
MEDIKKFINDYLNEKPQHGLTTIFKNNKELNQLLINETSFLSNNAHVKQRVWHIKNNVYSLVKCYCGNDISFGRKNYPTYCSSKCRNNDPIKKEKTIRTNIEKYGVDNPMKSESVKKKVTNTKLNKYGSSTYNNSEKSKKACQEKYGVDNISQLDIIKEKKKQTFLKNYGVEHGLQDHNIRELGKKTCLKKYGNEYYFKTEDYKIKTKQKCLEKYNVEHYAQSLDFKNKFKNTCIGKYGVEHISHIPGIHEKQNAYKYKEYTLPSGRIVKVQGYEDRALDILLEQYNEHDLLISAKNIFKEFGGIKYKGNNGKEHYYYPDIYIKSKHKIIEVKSNYTFYKDYDKNMLKKQACLEKGLNFEFMILD